MTQDVSNISRTPDKQYNWFVELLLKGELYRSPPSLSMLGKDDSGWQSELPQIHPLDRDFDCGPSGPPS